MPTPYTSVTCDPFDTDDGHELSITSLIFQAGMRRERDDGATFKDLSRVVRKISPALDEEFLKEGTHHRHAGRTLTELRVIYTGGVEDQNSRAITSAYQDAMKIVMEAHRAERSSEKEVSYSFQRRLTSVFDALREQIG